MKQGSSKVPPYVSLPFLLNCWCVEYVSLLGRQIHSPHLECSCGQVVSVYEMLSPPPITLTRLQGCAQAFCYLKSFWLLHRGEFKTKPANAIRRSGVCLNPCVKSHVCAANVPSSIGVMSRVLCGLYLYSLMARSGPCVFIVGVW